MRNFALSQDVGARHKGLLWKAAGVAVGGSHRIFAAGVEDIE